jgi:hypothetical protein
MSHRIQKFVLGILFLTAVGIRCADHVTPSNRKSRHYFADNGGRSVGIVRLPTKATDFFLFTFHRNVLPYQFVRRSFDCVLLNYFHIM